MYDVNPQGPLMHLKEVERRAIRSRQAVPREQVSALMPIWASFLRMLKRASAALAPKLPVG